MTFCSCISGDPLCPTGAEWITVRGSVNHQHLANCSVI